MKKLFILIAICFSLIIVYKDRNPRDNSYLPSISKNINQNGVYNLQLNRWKIHNDGKDPVDTTKGINKALLWAHENGYTQFKLPAGTYLISKDSQINMVSNMTFFLDNNAVIRKETNGKQGYITLKIGHGIHDVTLKGGTYKGDRNTHDFSMPGTHEGGNGIVLEAPTNITIDQVKIMDFTGDGIDVGGWGAGIGGFGGRSFESGSLNSKGLQISDRNKERTIKKIYLNNSNFSFNHKLIFDQFQNLSRNCDVYFYSKDNKFLSLVKNQHQEDWITIPKGAYYFRLVFSHKYDKKGYLMVWAKEIAHNVTVEKSESANNRRQALTVKGVDGLKVLNNNFHNTSGTAPSAGIDVESEGFFPDRNLLIKGNTIHDNAGPSIDVCDGKNIIIKGNKLSTHNVTVWGYIHGVTIKNNTFLNNSGINLMGNDAIVSNNTFNNAGAGFSGNNIKIDGVFGHDANISINSPQPYGISLNNVNITLDGKTAGGILFNGQPVHVSNVTITGPTKTHPLGAFGNLGMDPGSTFYHIKLLSDGGYNLPTGTYTYCELDGGATIRGSGKSVFNHCIFKAPLTSLVSNNVNADVTVENSSFTKTKASDWGNTILEFSQAKNLIIENNNIHAELAPPSGEGYGIIDIGLRGWMSKPVNVARAKVIGNKIYAKTNTYGINTTTGGRITSGYDIENNTLYMATLDLRSKDTSKSNRIINNEK